MQTLSTQLSFNYVALQILKSQVTAAQASTMKLAVNSEAQVLEFKARSGSMEDVLYHYYVHYVLFHVEDLKLLPHCMP